MTAKEEGKFILYRELGDGYRWRLRSPTGETLAASPSGHREKRVCEAELHAFMANHQGVKVLDLTTTGNGLEHSDPPWHGRDYRFGPRIALLYRATTIGSVSPRAARRASGARK